MTHIKVTRGLDIPISGKPSGSPKKFTEKPRKIALDLASFDGIRFQLLAAVGDQMKLGEPIAFDKNEPSRHFACPAAGKIVEIVRGEKRKLLRIIIEVAEKEEFFSYQPINLANSSREEIITFLAKSGCLNTIQARPFCQIVPLDKTPRTIFVKAVESAPFSPSAEIQLQGYEQEFQIGLDTLKKLTEGKVHLVHHINSTCKSFLEAKNVEIHTIEGPHPIGNASVHIHHIDPIRSNEDLVWSLDVNDVIMLGKMVSKGHYHYERVIAIAGEGFAESKIGLFYAREGMWIRDLASECDPTAIRLISGDVLTGQIEDIEGFLHLKDRCLCAIPEVKNREMLHFFRPGFGKFTASKTYISGFLGKLRKWYPFNTSQHGEERALIDPVVYDNVMPMNIPTMFLVKAAISKNYELAEELGILEVAPEDFALATFVCPSKVEMVHIMKDSILAYKNLLVG